MAMDAGQVQERYQRIAVGWMQSMPQGQWTSATCFWAETGPATFVSTIAIDLDGLPHTVSLPPDVHHAFRELREGMSSPERGAWISARAVLTPQGVLEVDYNWDRRYYYGNHAGFPWAPSEDPADGTMPSDDFFIEDLKRYPRAPMYLPAWYPTGDAADVNPAPSAPTNPEATANTAPERALLDEKLAGQTYLPDSVKPLMDAFGWPGVVKQVGETERHAIRNVGDDLVQRLSGERGHEGVLDGLEEFRDGVAGGVMLVIGRSSAITGIQLWRAWAAVQPQRPQEPEGLARLENTAPLEKMLAEPPIAAILPDLQRIVREIVTHDLATRFGVPATF